ncbi:MAG: hypothetical protein AAFQ82_08895, partial [Myxococcota bacterium]
RRCLKSSSSLSRDYRFRSWLRGDFTLRPSTRGEAALYAVMTYAAGLRQSSVDPGEVHLTGVPQWLSLSVIHWNVRAACICFDPDSAHRWAVFNTIAGAESGRAHCSAVLCSIWVELATRGPSLDLIAPLRDTESEARSFGCVDLVVESIALQAWCALEFDVDEATGHARRAARLARTEKHPQQEYLANLILARVRRAAGSPHLSARILYALREVAPPLWQTWLDYELFVSGAIGSQGARLANWVTALDSPNSDRLEAFEATVHKTWGVFPQTQRELRLLFEAVRPEQPTDNPFMLGETHTIPGCLFGLARLPGRSPLREMVLAYIYSEPGRAPRRFFRLGYRRALNLRPELLIAGPCKSSRALALLGRLVFQRTARVEDLVSMPYSREFGAAADLTALDVVIHRARRELRDLGTLTRSKDTLSLRLDGSVLLPDGVCIEGPSDRVLLAIGRAVDPASSEEIAAAVGLAPRTVQAVLKTLIEDGVCEVLKEGRRTRYLVVDSVFSTPITSQSLRAR